MQSVIVKTALFLSLAVPLGVSAQGAGSGGTDRQSTFDVSILAGTCFNCHGTEGRSPGAIPSIAGRPEAALRAQLLAFKSESPPAATTVMNRLAKGYTDAEIDALARYFSRVSR